MLFTPKLKRIAVFTSGGDAPGMNACIRAVVRGAIYYGVEVYGIRRGYAGMIEGDIFQLSSRHVSGIIQRGGTILKSARSLEFKTIEGRAKAVNHLRQFEIEGLVAIGGDGTFRGAMELIKEHKIPVLGCPGTIDNDLYGTDFTIGYDTATNTVIEAIDKVKDTADAHDRLFFIEVMGRDAGFIALRTGISCGAEAILIPETKTSLDDLVEILRLGRPSKNSSLVVVAEGDDEGGAMAIAEKIKKRFTHYETKVTILGHVQRGGSPSCADRVLASRLGFAALEHLLQGESDCMVGQVHKDIVLTPFEKSTKHGPALDKELLRMAKIISL